MKFSLKRIGKGVVSAVCCVALAATFVGCGEKSGSADVKTVEVWSPDSHSKTVMNELVNNWNETKGKELGLKIVYTVKEGDIKQAVDMAMISKQAPDLFSSVDVTKYSDSHEIYPISDLPGGEEMIAKYDKDLLKSTSFTGVDGKVYCLPATVLTFGLVYNKDMFRKYGIVDENGEPTPPKTFAQVREYAKRMTNEKEQDFGIILPMKWGAFYATDVNQLVWGGAGRTAFDCRTGQYDFSHIKPIYEMYKGMKDDGSIFPGPEGLDNDMARAYFAERNIGMKFAGSYDVGVFNSQFPAKCDWGVAPYPVADENNAYKRYMMVGGHYSLTTSAVEKLGADKAMEVLKFFYSDEMARKLYEEGMAIPYNAEVTKGVTPKEGLVGWDAFASFVEIGTSGYSTASVEITGEDKDQDVFMNKVWTGAITVDQAIAELNERYNRGMKTYYTNNPNKKVEDKINKNWNSKID